MGTVGVFLQQLLFSVVVFFNRILTALQQNQSLHTARFAHLHELAELLTDRPHKTSLLLGVSHFNRVLHVRPTKARRELGNLLVVAPTRGGKGLLATSQLLTWPHSVIVNDIKGDLFTQTAGYRSILGKVFVIDPTGIGHWYDPLLGHRTEDELLSAATHLLYKPDEEDGAIFTQRATVMLTQVFLAARAEGLPPLPYVRHMIRAGLQDAAERLNAINPDLATQFLDVRYEAVNFDDRFLLSAWGTLTARMRPLLTETLIRSLSGSDFSPSDLLYAQQPITVYLRWSERDLLALSPLVRLMWGTLIDGLITTYDNAQGRNCQPVLLLIDEAGRTAIPSLADHATTVVGRGISLWIAVQSLAQLDAVYGRTRASVLRDNMESQIYYRPSNQETADYLQHCLGRKSDYARSETLREGTATSEGRSEQGIPLMTAQDIKQLRDDDIIGFHRLLPPFRAKRIDWRNFPSLTLRQAIPAPQLATLPDLAASLFTPALERPQHFADGYIDPDME
jgi:type IV secretion system protein VirD4